MIDKPAITYRPDIDGLRALAVLPVVAYHAAPKLAPGGFAGVDVFFVISGFLISAIILREKDEGRLSILNFYARRIRRLFPALATVLAVTLALAWFYLLPHEFRQFGRHLASGAAYVINFTLNREAGYFDAAAEEKPLLHLWSLAVEEQFYLVWPVLLLLASGKRQTIAVLALIVAASFASNILTIGKNSAAAFFLPQNRFWELSLGALLACANHWALAKPQSRTADIASISGLALIVGTYWGLNGDLPYPGHWALLPTLGATLLIGAGPGALINRLILAQPLLVFVGLISYPLYLWHWPLLSLLSVMKLNGDAILRAGTVALAFLLSWITYRFIEKPLRHGPGGLVPAALFASSIAICAAGLLAKTAFFPPRLNDPKFHDIGEAAADWAYPDGLAADSKPSGLIVRSTGKASHKTVYFGDSNIEQYWPRVRHLVEQRPSDHRVVFLTTGGCPPIRGVRERHHPNCNGFAEAAANYIKSPDVTAVVLAASWIGYFGRTNYYIGDEKSGALDPNSEGSARAFAELALMMNSFTAAGKKVWLVLNIPAGAAYYPQAGLRRSLSGDVFFEEPVSGSAQSQANAGYVRASLIEAAQKAGAELVDPWKSLCNQDLCPRRDAGGKLMYKDGSHLRASFVAGHAAFIDQTLASGTATTTGE